MDEVIVVARAIEDALANGHCSSADAARAAIAALDECRNREELRAAAAAANAAWDKVGVTEHPSVQFRRGREAGLREAAARFANLPGVMSGAGAAAILALIDAKEID